VNNPTVLTRAVLLIIGAGLSLVIWLLPLSDKTTGNGLLSVYFLDIGQGDAIFIETPDGIQMLIDGGPDSTILRELRAAMPRFDRSIDVLMATHPDKDHIGGLIDVLARYQVANIMSTSNSGDTSVATMFGDSSKREEAKLVTVEAGKRYRLGEFIDLLVFSPASAIDMESNAGSIVMQIRFGDTSVLLTGDATLAIEDYLANRFGNYLQSDILKLGHHGSRTSTSANFLETVSPQYAVVSAGRGNSYGHPHDEVVERVVERNIELLNTAESGRVGFVSDGLEWRLLD